jgi:hypothetical protein
MELRFNCHVDDTYSQALETLGCVRWLHHTRAFLSRLSHYCITYNTLNRSRSNTPVVRNNLTLADCNTLVFNKTISELYHWHFFDFDISRSYDFILNYLNLTTIHFSRHLDALLLINIVKREITNLLLVFLYLLGKVETFSLSVWPTAPSQVLQSGAARRQMLYADLWTFLLVKILYPLRTLCRYWKMFGLFSLFSSFLL